MLSGLALAVISCGAAPRALSPDPMARRAAAVSGAEGGPASEATGVPLAKPGNIAAGDSSTADRGPRREPRARMVIKTANLELITRDPNGAFDEAVALAKELGGYTLSSSHGTRKSSVTLRVPAARFEEALQRLCKLGKVDRREVTGTDVTSEFVDMSIRLTNAERARQRYLELLQRSANVSEALQVQRELERITSTIEQLRGQLDLMQHQVSMSTINLTLEKPARPGPLGWIFYGLYHAIRWLFIWS
jgi:hypothetical protein